MNRSSKAKFVLLPAQEYSSLLRCQDRESELTSLAFNHPRLNCEQRKHKQK